MAADRGIRQNSVSKADNEFEEDRRDAQMGNSSKKKARDVSSNTLDVTFTCGHCSLSNFSHITLVNDRPVYIRRGHILIIVRFAKP